MGLKITREGPGEVWKVEGTFRGVRIRKSARTTDRKTAETYRAALENQILEGEFGKRHPTFAEAAEGYLTDGGDRRFLLKPFEALHALELRQITPATIRQLAADAYPGNATRNRQFITPAQAVINWAHQQGWCGLIRVKRFDVKKAERKTVDRAWIEALRAEAPPHLFAAYLFMFTTGARVSEALRLTWADVDLANRTALLRETKNGADHTAHLSDELCAIMAALPIGPRVFRYKSRHSLYGPLQNACKRAGIQYVPPHQGGRHSFATALDAEGMTAAQIAKAGGWKSVRLVSETYTHPEDAGKRAADIMSGKKLPS